MPTIPTASTTSTRPCPRIAREQFTYLGGQPGEDRDRARGRAPEPRARAGRRDSTCSPWMPSPATRSRSTSSRCEAVGVYLRHMKPTGVIAFHVSNRFLDLKPVLLAIAERHGLEYAFVARDDRGRRHHQRLGAAHAQQAAHPAPGDRGVDRARARRSPAGASGRTPTTTSCRSGAARAPRARQRPATRSAMRRAHALVRLPGDARRCAA